MLFYASSQDRVFAEIFHRSRALHESLHDPPLPPPLVAGGCHTATTSKRTERKSCRQARSFLSMPPSTTIICRSNSFYKNYQSGSKPRIALLYPSPIAVVLFAAEHGPLTFATAVPRTRGLNVPNVKAKLADFEILIGVWENGHTAVQDHTYQWFLETAHKKRFPA